MFWDCPIFLVSSTAELAHLDLHHLIHEPWERQTIPAALRSRVDNVQSVSVQSLSGGRIRASGRVETGSRFGPSTRKIKVLCGSIKWAAADQRPSLSQRVMGAEDEDEAQPLAHYKRVRTART
jgi:hypothetical protein